MLIFLIACSGEKDSNPTDTGPVIEGDPVKIQFAALSDSAPFACGDTYVGVGTTGSSFTATDLRFYVHAVTLTDAENNAYPVYLDQDGLWQYENLALLDFEDKSGPCENGTVETNTVLQGLVEPAAYTGIQFLLGVPFEMNHQDASTAASPLNLSTMFWGWEGGYKFLRLEGKTTGFPTGYSVHLGSTGCASDQTGQVTGCADENVAEISLSGFDPASSKIVLDINQIFAGIDIDTDGGGAPGCMSTVDDPECASIFAELGLSGQAQSVFSVQSSSL